MAITSSRRVAAGVGLIALAASGTLILTQHGSPGPSTAVYTDAGDGTVTKCQGRDYTTLVAVDIAWQVINHDSKPHDYKVSVGAAQGFEKEVDFSGLAPQYTKTGYLTILVTPAEDGSWPVVKCSITAVAS